MFSRSTASAIASASRKSFLFDFTNGFTNWAGIYTNFHVNPLCSASRVALLTGRNSHGANMGSVSEMATGFPGQNSVLPNSVAPLAKIMRFNGYSTAMFGKSHEYVPWESGLTGPFDQWPTGVGFERFYGNVIGESDQFSPSIHDNTTQVPPSKDPNYYYQTDIADHAISWIKTQKTLTPDKPFFVYYAAQGMHDPVQLPQSWRDKYKGKFDEGWDKYREEILTRQKKLGIVPANTQLTAKPDIMEDWDKLSPDEKKIAIRYQEVFAAFAELTDYEIGRVLQAADEMGAMDNTLIIYIAGDNGASPNGGRLGTFNTLSSFNLAEETLQYQLAHLDEVGGPHSAMTPPAGWSIGDNTPFAYSQFHTQYGGTTNGMVVFWPKVIKAKGEVRNQYYHLIDVAPTVLAAAGLPQPKTVNGVPQKPMDGVSMLSSFTNPQVKSDHTIQYYEFGGNRGIYRDGWYATTLHKVAWEKKPRGTFAEDKWELYNTAEDFSCSNNLAAKEPTKLKEMQNAFMAEAVKNNVLPLDDRIQERFVASIAGRPDLMAGRTSLTVFPGMVGMKENAFINVKNQSSSITADLEVQQRSASGVILAQGGAHSGWSLYVKGGKPAFAYNFLGNVTTIASKERLPAGPVIVTYDFVYDGGKLGAGGTGTISINGKKVATGRIEHTIPLIFGTETADVGTDLYSTVTTACAIHGIPLRLRHRRSAGRLRARNGLFLLELCILGGKHCLSLSLLSIAHLDEALLCLKAVNLRGVGRSGFHHCAICYGGLLDAIVKVPCSPSARDASSKCPRFKARFFTRSHMVRACAAS
ncbi:arylsulfatase [Edaphobacter modestus]|uniref:arylsulfatase n=1 Tax=Edaphobacter modestus TaxID=388466 RepID=UPI00102B46B4